MKDSCPLRKEYAEYSGLEATYADSGIEYPRRDYCAWLEKELVASRESRLLSAVPSGKTVVEIKNDDQRHCEYKKGERGYIDGWVRGGDGAPYAAVVIDNRIILCKSNEVEVKRGIA